MKSKIILQNKYSSVLLIVSMVMLSFLCFNGISILKNIQNMTLDDNYGIYKHVEKIYLENINIYREKNISYIPSDVIENSIKSKKTIGIHCTMYIGKATQQLKVIFVVTDDFETFYKNIIQDNNSQYKRNIVLGSQKTKNNLNIERNKKLLVCGEYLNVLNNVDIADLNESDHIYIKWDDMSDSIKKVFKEFTNPGAYIVTLFELDSKDKNEYLLDILSKNYRIKKIEEKESTSLNQLYKGFNTVFYLILIIYAIINCIVFSEIWTQNHMREYIIRKTFGMSLKDVIVIIVKKISLLSTISVVSSTIVQYLYIIIIGKNVLFNYNVLEFAKYIFEMIVLITIICIVIPIKRLSNIEPSKGLRFFGE